MYKDFTCQFLKDLLNQGAQLIDVRSRVEFNQGALSGAMNMPIDRFHLHKDDIDKTRPVLLYCRSGQRSERVKRFLEASGFSPVYNIGSYQKFIYC